VVQVEGDPMGGEVGSARTSATSMIRTWQGRCRPLSGGVICDFNEFADATIAVLVMFGAATTTVAHAQSTDELSSASRSSSGRRASRSTR